MTFAIPEDVAGTLGRPADSITDAERLQWQAWLSVVERRIALRFRRAGFDLEDRVTEGDPFASDVADVEVAAVIRKIQNPTWGRTSATHSLDDGSVTYRNEGPGAYVDPLDPLESELALILPSRGPGTARAFSVMPS